MHLEEREIWEWNEWFMMRKLAEPCQHVTEHICSVQFWELLVRLRKVSL